MERNNVWMSVSDLMTGLMVIFLFVSIAYLIRVDEEKTVLKDFIDNKRQLHDRLLDQFKSEREAGILTIGGDLSMRFQNAETLYKEGKWELEPAFKEQLGKIMPRYLGILLADTMRSKIREIRIEGHTDPTPYPSLDPSDPYMANLILSQRRALSVMYFLRQMPEYQEFSPKDKAQIEYWFTATGLSYGHALDSNGELVYTSGLPIDKELSRRVEIRIITTGEEVMERIISHKDSVR